GPTGLALVENTSVGVCFTGDTDSARLLPAIKEAPLREQTLLALAWDAVACQRDAKRPPRLLVRPEDAPLLEKHGLVNGGVLVEMITRYDGYAQLINSFRVVSGLA